MTKKEQVKEFIKEHKKEILITSGAIVGGVIMSNILGNCRKPNLKYGVIVKSDNKDFRDGLYEMTKWGANKPIENARIAWDCTKDQFVEYFTDYVDKDEPDKYLYCMVLEKIDKDNFK